MKIENLSPEAQAGLRLWAHDVHDDDLLFDDNASSPAFWAEICYQLWESKDRPEWFPKGKSSTIQFISAQLHKEARAALPESARSK